MLVCVMYIKSLRAAVKLLSVNVCESKRADSLELKQAKRQDRYERKINQRCYDVPLEFYAVFPIFQLWSVTGRKVVPVALLMLS